MLTIFLISGVVVLVVAAIVAGVLIWRKNGKRIEGVVDVIQDAGKKIKGG